MLYSRKRSMKGLFVFIWLSVIVFGIFASLGEGYVGISVVCGLGIFYTIWRKRRGTDEFKVNEFSKELLESLR